MNVSLKEGKLGVYKATIRLNGLLDRFTGLAICFTHDFSLLLAIIIHAKISNRKGTYL
jgi:hypothetical protein